MEKVLAMLPLMLLFGGVWWILRLRKNRVAVLSAPGGAITRWPLWALGIMSVFVIISTMKQADTTGSRGGTSLPVNMTYEVSGTAKEVRVSYSNNSGGLDTRVVPLPHLKSYYMRGGERLYVTAQNNAGDDDIEVSISLDGRKIESNKSSGPYAIATASARCCNRP